MSASALPARTRLLRVVLIIAAVFAAVQSSLAAAPSPPPGTDADTSAWWWTTAALADDAMEGRDTGSAGYERAASYVARHFQQAGLQPVGDQDGWLQSFPLAEVKVEAEGAVVQVRRQGAAAIDFEFLHEITVRATDRLPAVIEGPLSFRGYCSAAELGADMKGRIAVCFATRRQGLPTQAERINAASRAGAIAIICVDDPGFTIEPARWPAAYARSVRIAADPPPAADDLAVFSLSGAGFVKLLSGTGLNAAEILDAGAAQRPLHSLEIPGRLLARLRLSKRTYSAANVLALLPGTDPQLQDEVLVVSAHLDGYGYGAPVAGDTLYHGAFDDAAYVATLIRLAEQRHGHGFRRSVLFGAFAGEEKGLLGSTWFVRHPPMEQKRVVADINLDMLRPLFPLKALTMLARDRSTLADAAESVAQAMHIEIRSDREPERGLLQRADHWPFLQVGIPATTFVFAYDRDSEAERRYREWYNIRYHRPQDDMGQPIDFVAAATFNRFFYALTAKVADAPQKPVLRQAAAAAANP